MTPWLEGFWFEYLVYEVSKYNRRFDYATYSPHRHLDMMTCIFCKQLLSLIRSKRQLSLYTSQPITMILNTGHISRRLVNCCKIHCLYSVPTALLSHHVFLSFNNTQTSSTTQLELLRCVLVWYRLNTFHVACTLPSFSYFQGTYTHKRHWGTRSARFDFRGPSLVGGEQAKFRKHVP